MKRVCFFAIMCVMLSVSAASGDELADLIKKADAGNPQAQHALGWRYIDGKGVKQDKKQGFRWIEKAADQGYAAAENDLGYLYDHGIGTLVNPKMAKELFIRAAEHGDVIAQLNVGIYYEYGWRVNKNIPKAIRYYTMAAAQGNKKAKEALRRLNAPVPDAVKQETKQASVPVNTNFFAKAKQETKQDSVPVNKSAFGNDFNSMLERANRGDIEAQFQVGRMYEEGDGVAQDYRKAREWYEKAANRGHPAAQNNLGVLYDDGKGVAQDYRKAREWYEKAAAQNYGWAFDNLGILYHEGNGVNVDYKKAFEYYTKGAEKGIARSFNQLGWFYEHGLWVKVDYNEAFSWYTKGADKGNTASMNNLARMYEEGIGVSKDINKAIAFYRQSAAKGNAKGKKELARLEASQNTTAQQKPSVPPAVKVNTTKKPPEQPKTSPKPAQQKPQVPANSPKVAKNDNITQQQNTGSLFTGSTGAKPRLAVLDFEDRSEGKKANPEAIMNMMVSELHKAGGFTLLERERLDDISKEIKLGQSGLVDTSTAVKIGKLQGAQYVMTGAITLYQYHEKASGFVIAILGAEAKAKTAYVVLDIRIINVETSEIVYAYDKTGQSTQRNKNVNVIIKDYDKMVGGLLDTATRDAVKKHVSAINIQSW